MSVALITERRLLSCTGVEQVTLSFSSHCPTPWALEEPEDGHMGRSSEPLANTESKGGGGLGFGQNSKIPTACSWWVLIPQVTESPGVCQISLRVGKGELKAWVRKQ